MKLELIAQHSDFILVYKPADISFQDESDLGAGFFNQVKEQFALNELYPVHRLDKITSGLMIMATTKPSARQFQQLFSQHKIEKYYLAISDKKPKKKQGLIKGDMSKSRRGMYKLEHSSQNPAITQFFSYSIGPGKRLYLLKPHSGKTHQIRVALNSISAPILGDCLYGNESADRGYLHAYALKFNYCEQEFAFQLMPTQGEHFLAECTKTTISNIGEPWLLSWPKI